MLLENNSIEMKWSNNNKRKYQEKGYAFTGNNEVFYAKVKDVLECSSGVKIPVRCDYCKNIYYPTTTNYLKMHKKNLNALDCCVKCKGNKIRNTVQEKYNVDNVVYLDDVKRKMKETCEIKYEASSPLQNKNIFDKTQESLNYHYNLKNGIKDLRTVDELNNKIIRTNMKKYGGKSPFCSNDIKLKIRKSFYENGTCKTSKKQILLYETLKSMYGNCELNYPCDVLSLDCMVMIDNFKFDIEYDGWYWHKDTKDRDRKRNFVVMNKGYKVLRFLAIKDRLPTENEIKNSIDYLIKNDYRFLQIILT